MIAVFLTSGRQPHGAQPGPSLPGLAGKPRGRGRHGYNARRGVLVVPALSHLPTGQSQSQKKGRDPAGSHSTLPVSSSSQGLSQPQALAHLSPSLSPFSQPEGVAQLAGPSRALARPWSWLGKAACRQLPGRGAERQRVVCSRGPRASPTHCEKSPAQPLSMAKQFWVTRKRQESSGQRARHPGRWDGQELRQASPCPCHLAIQPSRSPRPSSGGL